MRYTQSEIAEEGRRIDGLHKRIHVTLSARYNSRKECRAWHSACDEFHSRDSFFDRMMERAFLNKVIFEDGDERESAISVLEADPICYRSGYLKGKLTRALKQADLSAQQRERLWWLIKTVAASPPQVGFRDYCRLALKVADGELYVHFKELATNEAALVRRRAKLMLRYLRDHGGFGD